MITARLAQIIIHGFSDFKQIAVQIFITCFALALRSCSDPHTCDRSSVPPKPGTLFVLAVPDDLVMATESLQGVICGLRGSFSTQFLLIWLGAATVLQNNPLLFGRRTLVPKPDAIKPS